MNDDIIKRKSVQKFQYAMQFNEFEKTLNLQFRCAMHYKPKIMNFSTDMRYYGCLLYIVNGSYTYAFYNNKFVAEKEDVIYLPYGSKYKYHINEKNTEIMQVEFNISSTGGEIININNSPVLVKKAPGKIKNMFIETVNLKDNTSLTHKLKAMSNIYSILSFVSESMETKSSRPQKGKIVSALNYIENNSEKKMYIKDLACMCGLSESRFRKKFKDEEGMSPLEYKNYKRLQNAITLVKTGNISMSEVAENLGFENIYAFSQFFKKHTGTSPSKYTNNEE